MRLKSLTPMLAVADIERSIAFYRDALGLSVKSTFVPEGATRPSWARLCHGDVGLMLSGHGGVATGEPARRGHADARLYIMTDDVMAARSRGAAAGASVRGPWVRFYGIKEIELNDPDGYTLVIGENTDEKPTPE